MVIRKEYPDHERDAILLGQPVDDLVTGELDAPRIRALGFTQILEVAAAGIDRNQAYERMKLRVRADPVELAHEPIIRYPVAFQDAIGLAAGRQGNLRFRAGCER